MAMILTIATSGGFAGLTTETRIDVGALSNDLREEVCAVFAPDKLGGLMPAHAGDPGAADMLVYHFEAVDEGERGAVDVREDALPEAVLELIDRMLEGG